MTDPVKILILEDQTMIAFALEDMLHSMGFETVGPYTNAAAALAALEKEDFHFALLDINLGGEKTSAPFADALMARDMPFAFVTGYGSAHGLPDRFASIGCYTKPIREDDVASALRASQFA